MLKVDCPKCDYLVRASAKVVRIWAAKEDTGCPICHLPLNFPGVDDEA